MVVDWTFRAGDILVFLAFAGTVSLYIFRAGKLAEALASMQQELSELKQVASVVANILTTVAVQKNEIEHLRTDIDDLRRGHGYIINRETGS